MNKKDYERAMAGDKNLKNADLTNANLTGAIILIGNVIRTISNGV